MRSVALSIRLAVDFATSADAPSTCSALISLAVFMVLPFVRAKAGCFRLGETLRHGGRYFRHFGRKAEAFMPLTWAYGEKKYLWGGLYFGRVAPLSALSWLPSRFRLSFVSLRHATRHGLRVTPCHGSRDAPRVTGHGSRVARVVSCRVSCVP